MTFTHALSTNNYGEAKFIVTSSLSNGTHTTIASALTAAVSGETIFIRTGTYTENLTLKAGVNLAAWDCDPLTPNVTIAGTCTATFAGTCTLSGIRLQTNGATFLTVSGSAATIVNLEQCYLDVTNNNGISMTTSSGSAEITMAHCRGNIGTTGITYFTSSSPGSITSYFSRFSNTGSSTTASTASAGTVTFFHGDLNFAITTSSTAAFGSFLSNHDIASLNTTVLTAGGSGVHNAINSSFASGTASAISIGGTLTASSITVNSTNTNPITGAGTLISGLISITNTGNTINTTARTARFSDINAYRAPGQPAFLASQTSAQNNLPINATTTFTINNEVFDQGANYNSGTFTFTAPVTGRYLLIFNIRLNSIDTATGSMDFQIVTSNRSYLNTLTPGTYFTADSVGSFSLTALADMDAADTALTNVIIANSGTGQADVQVDSGTQIFTYFSGILLS